MNPNFTQEIILRIWLNFDDTHLAVAKNAKYWNLYLLA